MRFSVVNLAMMVLSASMASAQTWTACDPLSKACPDDPALAGTYTHDFGGAASDFTTLSGDNQIMYGGADGAVFRVVGAKDAPTIVSNFYIMFGRVDVELKMAPGGGIVSSFVLQSDDLDEIDWEWVGSKTNESQSNYFGKGNTSSYDRGGTHPSDGTQFHTFSLDWTATRLQWIIDDVIVRTLTPANVTGDFYPQTPMQLRIGSWAAGDSNNAPGTVAWAGGPINYSQGPFDMLVKSMKVTDYSNGTVYRYGDHSGHWQSIIAVNGTVGAGPQTGPGNAGHLVGVPTSTASALGAAKTGLLVPTSAASGNLNPNFMTIAKVFSGVMVLSALLI